MIQLSCNACHQILPWVLRSKKVNCIKFIRCFILKIEVKTTKGHWPFVQGSFLSLSDSKENGLKLIRLSRRLRKCIVSYTLNVPILIQGGQSSMATDHRPIWALTSDPLIHILPDFLDICKTIPFVNHFGDQINLSPFSLKSDQLENLTPCKKVNDLLLI